MKMMRRRMVLAGMLAPALASLAGRAAGQGRDYYKDKIVNINVAGGPSGGHTRYARLIQPYLQRHSGAREVRITNMQGGGGLKAANYIWRVKPDGLQIFFGNVSTLILAQLAGSPGATFDPDQVHLPRARHQRTPGVVRRRQVRDQEHPGRAEAQASLRLSVAGH